MKRQTIKDESMGVIPVFKDDTGKNFFLVVLHNAGHWAFPKGHKQDNENKVDTAMRELYEETGIKDIKLDDRKEFLESYSFEEGGKIYNKTVWYFVALVPSRETSTPSEFKHEIEQTKWLSYSDALEILTHSEAKDLLGEVKKYLELT